MNSATKNTLIFKFILWVKNLHHVTFSKLWTFPWKIFTHLSLGANGRTSQILTAQIDACREVRREPFRTHLHPYELKLKLPVLSMEFDRRYDPSELRLSPLTESL